MSKVRPSPCSACPYRKDVPSGVWAAHEYDKLVDYDAPTGEQPIAAFSCHASPEAYCHGWAVVHENRGRGYELIALRIWPVEGGIPAPSVELFASGSEAAAHGKQELDDPSPEAQQVQASLMRKHPRLRIDHEHR